MLPLPLCRPAAHLGSPEKLTFLPRGGQCLKMILSDFYIMKRIKKIFKCHLLAQEPSLLFPFSDPVLLMPKIESVHVGVISTVTLGRGNKDPCLMAIVILPS